MKIALVGTADFSIGKAPYEDASWDEIWGQGFWSLSVKRFTRWFELHDLDIPLKGNGNGKTGHEDNTNILSESPFSGGKPIYIQRPHPLIPDGVVYPIEEMLLKFGVRHVTSTTAFMLMYAINVLRPTLARTEKPQDRIGLWGIEMMESGEYTLQRAGVEHFLDVCVMLNIPVTLPAGCDLRTTAKIYAYEHETGKERKLREFREECNTQLGKWQDRGEECNKKISFHMGLLSAVDLMGKGQTNG